MFCFMQNKIREFTNRSVSRHPCLSAAVVALLAGFLTAWFPFAGQKAVGWGCVVCCGVLIGVFLGGIAVRKSLPDSDTQSGVLLWGMGAFLRLGYILRMQYHQFQHDVGHFTDEGNHAGYILYLMREGHLPDFDVRDRWQFYHPPLHHTIAAIWMRLMTMLNMDTDLIYESIQILPFVYSCVCLAVFMCLLKHFNVKGLPFVLTSGIMALHPTFIILAGSINNDMLSIMFMMIALLMTCKWYREQKLSTILIIAVSIGCAMMSKLSGYLAAPAAATVFLLALWQNRKKPLPLIKQYVAFGCVCVPLGLWWVIRNYIRFEVPITYVQRLPEGNILYVGDIPIWQRLLDFSPKQFSFIYDNFVMYGQTYNEYNPFIGLMKTAVFGEFVNTDRHPLVVGSGEVLFWAQMVLAFLAFWAMIWVCRKHSELDTTEKLALAFTHLITFASYMVFCLDFAHTCTQDMRYATPVIYVSLLFLGMFLTKAKPVVKKTTACFTSIFMMASFLIYGILIFA